MERLLMSIAAVLMLAGVACASESTLAGADKGGNKDGSIPAWQGKEGHLPGWSYGKYRGDYWKHKDEKPLFTIDAANVDRYRDKLSTGQVQLIKQTKGYKMAVYPSHRDADFPEFIAANTKKNLGHARLTANGNLVEGYLPGIPFPYPKTGAEAIMNFMVRYQGVGIDYPAGAYTCLSPRAGSSEWVDLQGPQHNYFPYGKKGTQTPAQIGDVYYQIYFQYKSPAALAGQGLVQTWYFNKENEAFYYFPGQRRVRRLPSAAYDTPQIGFENQYTFDQPYLLNGQIDRHDWKLVGKKEMYIPYNSFGMFDFRKKLHEVAQPGHLSNDSRRYELHRVWVVEGTVKKGMRHTAHKRVFYIDEDSWLAVAGEDYDAQGKLWKVREAYPIPVWELGGVMANAPFVQYDLTNGRYIYDQGSIGTGKDIKWYAETSEPRFRANFFTGDNLRSISER